MCRWNAHQTSAARRQFRGFKFSPRDSIFLSGCPSLFYLRTVTIQIYIWISSKSYSAVPTHRTSMIMCTQPNCSNYCDDNSPKLACKHPLNLCPKDLSLLIRAHIKKGQTIVKCPNSTCTAFMYNTDVRKWMYQNDENESEFLCHHPLALESLNAISFFLADTPVSAL